MITPGTTPTQTITFPAEINPSACTEITLVFAQDRIPVVVKHKNDFTISGQTASVVLTANETKSFDWRLNVEIEIWVKLADGTVPEPYRTTESVDTVIGSAE